MTDTPLASLRVLLDLCARYMSSADLDVLRTAYAVANNAHAGVKRVSGEQYIEHPIAVATILAEMAIDIGGIAAALLHDTVEDTSLTLEDVEQQFGAVVASIVDGVTKFSAEAAELAVEDSGAKHPRPQEPFSTDKEATRFKRERKARQQSETVRKLLFAMSQEPRVALVKIADRIHNLRTMAAMSPQQREVKSRETLNIYAPLAGRLGLYLIKAELEDRAFAFLEPETFDRVSARLNDEVMKRGNWARRLCERTNHELAAQGIIACVNWRLKHVYRSYREAEDNGMDIGGLHDLIAFRVLVSTRNDCYQAMRVIHSLWLPLSDRIRDYIATPKINGYQSIHTAVFALDGRMTQFHIRTHRMHRADQHGIAAYWLERAAQGMRVDETMPIRVEQALGWVTQLAAYKELDLSAEAYVATVQGDLLEDQVVVYTPKGEARELPEGSTVLDFAYRIHTNIGDHATGAQVGSNNNQGMLLTRQVPVDYVLQRGDIIRVTTAPEIHPNPDWLTIAQTHYAHERIARTLRQLRRTTDTERTRHINEPFLSNESDYPLPLLHPSNKSARIDLARCCYPCPNDAIVGLVKVRNHVAIHRECCHTLKRILAKRAATHHPYAAALQVTWPEIQPLTYRVHLLIGGEDHAGLMHELTTCVAHMGLNVSGTRADANQSRYKAAVILTLDIPPGMRHELIMQRLQRAIPSVTSIRRDTRKGCEL